MLAPTVELPAVSWVPVAAIMRMNPTSTAWVPVVPSAAGVHVLRFDNWFYDHSFSVCRAFFDETVRRTFLLLYDWLR
jgi:hypothetical protein